MSFKLENSISQAKLVPHSYLVSKTMFKARIQSNLKSEKRHYFCFRIPVPLCSFLTEKVKYEKVEREMSENEMS